MKILSPRSSGSSVQSVAGKVQKMGKPRTGLWRHESILIALRSDNLAKFSGLCDSSAEAGHAVSLLSLAAGRERRCHGTSGSTGKGIVTCRNTGSDIVPRLFIWSWGIC